MAKFKVSQDDVGKRADVFIRELYPDFTRSSLERLFDNQSVSTDKTPVKAGQKLKTGQIIEVDDSWLKVKPPKINLPVIYEDSSVTVIDKPEGILSHSKGVINDEATVASFITKRINDSDLAGNRAGIVHRLDRGTSGVIITAKNSDSLKHLQKQFSQRRTKKTYLAIVEGKLEPSNAIIDVPIMRNPKRPQTFMIASRGKPATTAYKVIREFKYGNKEYSLVEMSPTTGRTHQLRVHMKYLNHPIVGDHIYGQAADHIYLHAKSLELTLPGGERRIFEAALPDYFKEFTDE